MPTRNTQVKNTSRTRSSRPADSRTIITEENEGGLSNFFKFGESYTSLILGIIVVIIATILLLSFIRNKNVTIKTQVNHQNVAVKPERTHKILTDEHKIDTVKNTINQAPKPAVIEKTSPINGSTYTVMPGDSLWIIAEAKYKNGYNWVDIAKANNLANPSVLYTGMKLSLPKVETKLADATSPPTTPAVINIANDSQTNMADTTRITGTTYTIAKGDSLWTIAVRAYGDGYQWTKLETANNLTNNPGLIHSGNTLTIPR